jgi:hypothetical protein
MAKQHKLSRHETTVLKLVAGGNGAGSIDAADFADEIVSLMQAGLVELGGTLSQPTIATTRKGREIIESNAVRGYEPTILPNGKEIPSGPMGDMKPYSG